MTARKPRVGELLLIRRDLGLAQVRGVTVLELLWRTKDNSGIAHLPDLLTGS